MLIEAFYILFFYFTGEFISYFIDGFIPGSVIGMQPYPYSRYQRNQQFP